MRRETDRKIMQAALDIALSKGVDAITIKAISRESGVATTTIYRRYKNTEDLLHNLFLPDVVASPAFADLEPSKNTLHLLISGLAEYLESAIGVRMISAAVASDSTFYRSIVEGIINPVREKIKEYFSRGVKAGIFRHDLDMELILELILGSTVSRALFHGEVTEEWTRKITDYLWPAMSHA